MLSDALLTDKNLIFSIRVIQRKMAKIYPTISLQHPQMYFLSCQLDQLVVEYMRRQLSCPPLTKVL